MANVGTISIMSASSDVGSGENGLNKQLRSTMSSLVRPPQLQVSKTLNKALFTKTFNLTAASVRDNKNIPKLCQALKKSGDLLWVPRIPLMVPDPDAGLAGQGRKCLLLKPNVSLKQPETWGPVLSELVKRDDVGLVSYRLELDYDYWTYRDVLLSLLPQELHDDIPSGFNTAGHVAHLNLREQYLPYKQLIGQVILDKNKHIETVINKTDEVGNASGFRTFGYEVLAGKDDLNVEVLENGCVFKFNYANVFWNSKLETEHTRMIGLFKQGEAVCDVMAGIGPFAVPGGKKRAFIWANDWNPESYKHLRAAIERNKVSVYVRPFNEDGRVFIQKAADRVLAASRPGETVVLPSKEAAARRKSGDRKAPLPRPAIPSTINHFVMNLPASAIDFIPFYRGLYAGQEALFSLHTKNKLPLIHVYCFAIKSEDDEPKTDICERVSKELGVTLQWDGKEGASITSIEDGYVAIHNVRDVAPAKSMYCASFRLPAQVAFAPR